MKRTLAFDVYGTLIDPLGVTAELSRLIGNAAPGFAVAWRDKQIEYLFRRGLGRDYASFSMCTRQALDYTCAATGCQIGPKARDTLMACYLRLRPYPEAAASLESLGAAGFGIYAFSNGDPDDLATLFSNADLESVIDGIVSVYAARSFKPDPAVYAHFCDSVDTTPEDTWLVSGNPFDVIGALKAGWRAAWVRRNKEQIFDPWGVEPTVVVDDLSGLLSALE